MRVTHTHNVFYLDQSVRELNLSDVTERISDSDSDKENRAPFYEDPKSSFNYSFPNEEDDPVLLKRNVSTDISLDETSFSVPSTSMESEECDISLSHRKTGTRIKGTLFNKT